MESAFTVIEPSAATTLYIPPEKTKPFPADAVPTVPPPPKLRITSLNLTTQPNSALPSVVSSNAATRTPANVKI